jgi:hypothetical protein
LLVPREAFVATFLEIFCGDAVFAAAFFFAATAFFAGFFAAALFEPPARGRELEPLRPLVVAILITFH